MIIVLAGVGVWVLEDMVDMSVHPLRWFVQIYGTVSILYALYDCIYDVLLHKIDNAEQGKSDAVALAEEVGGGSRCWGLLWSMISLTAVAVTLMGMIALLSSC
eukprot:GHVO01057895.1.p1 GENE.GHVO01057895.1~~GHVO01057895.1.p1  ORF type:complete len:103 (-),score=14.51 GHVO01057895.1:215-523(-)